MSESASVDGVSVGNHWSGNSRLRASDLRDDDSEEEVVVFDGGTNLDRWDFEGSTKVRLDGDG